MKETLYRFLGERNPRAKARYEALRQAGAPRWKAAPALLLPGGGGARPLPVGAGESAQSLGEPPAVLVQRLARFQAVSFDVFDTLLLRQVERPQEAFALVGAKLLYLLPLLPRLAVELPLLWEEPGEFYARYLSGGMVFYGGFFGGVAAAWGAAKYLRLRLSDFFPVLVPALPLVHAVGRVGCFCAGCCYGRAAPPPWGIAFTHAIAGPNGVPLLPVQLWEAGAELVIFAFLLWYAGRAAGPGQMLRAYVFCYAPVRFVLEWFRGDPARGMYGPFSTSQWLSLVVLALALAWPVAGRKLKKYVRERVSQQKGNRDKSDSAHS